MKKRIWGIILLLVFLNLFQQNLFCQSVSQQEQASSISLGNTAWVLISTALVMLMTIPGLALFYGGLVRRKNLLNIIMQCFIIMLIISIEWVVLGYSMSFGSSEGFLKPFIGGFDWAFLNNIKASDLSPYAVTMPNARIPHVVFIMYQCMFAAITPALIIGAFAERIKFKGFVIFSLLWALFIYNPVTHWMWSSDGWLFKMGALDFAGGIVVHITAGISALIMAIMLGWRRYYNNTPTPPHNIPFVAIGTGILWFGWFGFNAGSGLAADGVAGNAMLVTHIAAATAGFVWALLDWFINKKPTTIGVCTGIVAGLAAITPTAGFIDVRAAIIVSTISSITCFIMVGYIKIKLGYDDSLDAFGVHGIAGIIGSLLVGIFASPAIQGSYQGFWYGNKHQLTVQLIAVGATIVYSAIITFLLYKLVDKFFGLRVNPNEENEGLDFSQHNEIAYNETD
ncbi:MAG TPA: ammonium transporter [Bacteroidales bacterium]|nr:ammonium transporter [Bacteroidales bacterium]